MFLIYKDNYAKEIRDQLNVESSPGFTHDLRWLRLSKYIHKEQFLWNSILRLVFRFSCCLVQFRYRVNKFFPASHCWLFLEFVWCTTLVVSDAPHSGVKTAVFLILKLLEVLSFAKTISHIFRKFSSNTLRL